MDAQSRRFGVMDVQVGGKFHRIVPDGASRPLGASVREPPRYLEYEADGIRPHLRDELRGALPSFPVDLVTEFRRLHADAGVIVMEYMGCPRFSGPNLRAAVP